MIKIARDWSLLNSRGAQFISLFYMMLPSAVRLAAFIDSPPSHSFVLQQVVLCAADGMYVCSCIPNIGRVGSHKLWLSCFVAGINFSSGRRSMEEEGQCLFDD